MEKSLWQRIFSKWSDIDEIEDELTNKNKSFVLPKNNDGATDVEVFDNEINSYSHFEVAQIEPRIQNTKQLIEQYRQLMMHFEVDDAVQEIVDDAIVYEDNIETVHLDLDGTEFSKNIKDRIHEEFQNILSLYDFEKRGSELFKRWYVDSRLYFHKIVDEKNQSKNGITELRQLDPRNIELVRKFVKKRSSDIDIIEKIKEVFVYTPKNDSRYGYGFYGENAKPIELPKSSIVYSHSGQLSPCGNNIIGYLHRAIRPANQLKMLEDSLIIYRVTRAPERRVWYIDVGNMSNKTASQYVNSVAQGFKNKMVYDSATGRVKTQSNNLTMSEDFYLQRRGNGASKTEVQPLAGASNLGEITDVEMFRRNLYMALRVPLSRMPRTDGGMQIGSNGEAITRDEIKFSKFIRTLRKQFAVLLTEPLGSNLILKKIIETKEWEENKNNIKVIFNNDSYFDEAKEVELINMRLNAVDAIQPITGKYVSHEYVMKNILKMTDEQIEEEQTKIKEEQSDLILNPKDEEFNIGSE